tara:strand:+ start:384 stop:530 length:147 start_codon:yes stop_codon:yes gene_type:complete
MAYRQSMTGRGKNTAITIAQSLVQFLGPLHRHDPVFVAVQYQHMPCSG